MWHSNTTREAQVSGESDGCLVLRGRAYDINNTITIQNNTRKLRGILLTCKIGDNNKKVNQQTVYTFIQFIPVGKVTEDPPMDGNGKEMIPYDIIIIIINHNNMYTCGPLH